MSKAFLNMMLWLVILASILGVAWNASKDDTDPPDGRSGMVLYTDHKTGCQYLSRPLFGALTPRLDASGKQVCSGG